jgi:outer membrane murein-binding lipoprotein Lpp
VVIRRKSWVVGIVVFVNLLTVGCASTAKDWKIATEVDSVNGYQQFLDKHPDGKFAELAKGQICEIEWQNTKAQDHIGAYMQFANNYHQSDHYVEALDGIRRIVSERGRVLSNSDALVVLSTILEPIRKQYKKFSGDIILQTETDGGPISQIAVSDVFYTAGGEFFYCSSARIWGKGQDQRYGEICLFEGELYEIVPK